MKFAKWWAIITIVRRVFLVISKAVDTSPDMFVIEHRPSVDTITLHSVTRPQSHRSFLSQHCKEDFSYKYGRGL